MKPRRQRASSNANNAPPNNHNRTKSGSVPPAKPPQSVAQPQPSTGMTPALKYQHNLRALKRHDPSIFSIFDQFSHVCLYHYDESKWVKKGFEGSFFLFERHAYPPYGFFILNRMGMDDYVQYIYPEDDLNIQGAFLVYKYYPKFSATRLSTAHAFHADSRQASDSTDSSSGPPDRFTNAHGRVPSQLDVLTNWKYHINKGDSKGKPEILGLWMHSAGGRDMKEVMQRLHYYIKEVVPYPEQFRFGPDRPPTANPQPNEVAPSGPDGEFSGHQRSISKASGPNMVQQSNGASVSVGHAINGAGGSEVDKLFSKFLPSAASTPAPTSVTTTSADGKVSLAALFASASTSGTPGPSSTPGPAATTSSTPSSSAAKGVALLNSIFASAAPTPPVAKSYATSSVSPAGSTPVFQDSPSAPPSLRPSFAEAQKYSPYSSPPLNQPQYQIHSPKPAVAALPQILTQDVISSLLGLPSHSPASRTPSAAPSSASSRSQRRYEGDVDTSDNDAASDHSPALYSQRPYPRSEPEHFVPSIATPAGAGGSQTGHIHGDVTPKPPPRGFGIGNGSSHLSPSTAAAKKPDYSASVSEPIMTPEVWTAMLSESMATKEREKAKEQAQAQEKGRLTPGRMLVPFHEESTLWPYPRAPLDDRDTSDGAEVVELDFADTSALSDMDAFARRQKSKGKTNGRKSRKERERENQAERVAIENSWDAPPPMQPTPPPQAPVRPVSVVQPTATVVKPSASVNQLPPTTSKKAVASSVNGSTSTPSNGHDPSVGTRIDVNSLFRGASASQDTSPAEEGLVSRSAVSSAIISQVETKAIGQAPILEKNAFVREVLTLIHTDKRFVDQLYETYLTTRR